MTQTCTYIWCDPKNGIYRYVGKGKDLKRVMSHTRISKRPTRISKLLVKRLSEGYALTPIIIHAKDDADAIEMEMLLIEMIGREDLNLGPLFNLTAGGDGHLGFRKSEKTKMKHSISAKNMSEESKNNIKRGNQNRSAEIYQKGIETKRQRGNLKLSDECKKKISDKLKGKTKSNQHIAAYKLSILSRSEQRKIEISNQISLATSKSWILEFEDGRNPVNIINLAKWCRENPPYNFSSLRRTAKNGNFYRGVRAKYSC